MDLPEDKALEPINAVSTAKRVANLVRKFKKQKFPGN